jgi:CxxC motif-containing protein
MLPVRTDKPVSKAKMFEIMETLHSFTANCPVHRGDVLIADVCGTGANIISCKDM